MRWTVVLFGVALICLRDALAVYSQLPNPSPNHDFTVQMEEHRALVKEMKGKELAFSFGYAEDKVKSPRQIIIDEIINKSENQTLKNLESSVNQKLMVLKHLAIEEGLLHKPDQFLGIHDFTDVLSESRKTDLYKVFRKMPKGANLHAHSASMSSLHTLLEMATEKFCGEDYAKVWVLHPARNLFHIRGFNVSKTQPSPVENGLAYTQLRSIVASHGNGEQGFINEHLKPLLSLEKLNKNKRFSSTEEIWAAMDRTYAVLAGLLNYTPFLRKLIETSLHEMMQENIQFVEIRSTFGLFYNLTGKLSQTEAFHFFKEICTEFATKYKVSKELNQGIFAKVTFTGATKNPDKKQQADFFEIYKELVKKDKETKPVFLNGLYFLGSKEDASPASPLLDAYLPHIKQLATDPDTKNTSFYFNAGQNRMYKISEFENLYDAALLAKRIGNAYTLPKHPYLMELVKNLDVCIEVSLTANLAMQLNFDLHSHPMSVMMANNIQMVISPENSAFWNSTITDDFYLAFVFVAARDHGLSVIKKLILNSLEYSGMNDVELKESVEAWLSKYEKWLQNTDNTLTESDMAGEKKKLEWLELQRTDFFKDVITDDLREMRIPSKADESTKAYVREHNKRVQLKRLSTDVIDMVQKKVDHLRMQRVEGKSIVHSNGQDNEVSSGPLTPAQRAPNSEASKTIKIIN